jgi:DDE family transposase
VAGRSGFDQRSHSPGRTRYPKARRLLITADCGGSNGARVRLWKRELQALANELGLSITVCHLPPGTSTMEQDRASSVLMHYQNWRGKPLVSYQTAVAAAACRVNPGIEIGLQLLDCLIRSSCGMRRGTTRRATVRWKRPTPGCSFSSPASPI